MDFKPKQDDLTPKYCSREKNDGFDRIFESARKSYEYDYDNALASINGHNNYDNNRLRTSEENRGQDDFRENRENSDNKEPVEARIDEKDTRKQGEEIKQCSKNEESANKSEKSDEKMQKIEIAILKDCI